MNVRKAQLKDIPKIMELLRQVNAVHHNGRPDLFRSGTKYTSDELTALLNDKNRPILIAADENDEAAGYAFCIFKHQSADHILTDVKTLYIDDLCVDEKKRKQQIGKTLYQEALAFARENSCYHVTLNVWALNPGAFKFYEACGMKPLKTEMEVIL